VQARGASLECSWPEGPSIGNLLEARVVIITAETATACAEVLRDLIAQHLRAGITRGAVQDPGLAEGG